MINPLLMLLGRLYITRKRCWHCMRGYAMEQPVRMTDGPDLTGRVASGSTTPEIICTTDDLMLCEYPAMPWHSLWRSQEMSLLHRNRALILSPVLDYGCGDGSFGAALLGSVDIGGDADDTALEAAMRTGVYSRTINTTQGIPLENGSIATVIANSVLEHVPDVHGALMEIVRVLQPGGRLLMTVPTEGFTRHLTELFGSHEADAVNTRCVHRQLFSRGGWIDAVVGAGLRPEVLQDYQPIGMTFLYHMLSAPALCRLARIFTGSNRPLTRVLMSRLIRWSISLDLDGGNVLIVAEKGR